MTEFAAAIACAALIAAIIALFWAALIDDRVRYLEFQLEALDRRLDQSAERLDLRLSDHDDTLADLRRQSMHIRRQS